MIRILRKKFVLVNMLLVFFVLAVVFTALIVSGYQQAVTESMVTLQFALERHGRPRDPAHLFEVGGQPFEPMQRSPFFVAEYNEEGNLSLIAAENITVSDENLEALAALLTEASERHGIFQDFNLRWMEREDQQGHRVAFVDRTMELQSIHSAILTGVLSMLGAMVAFFFISLFFSRWALRPVETAWEQQRRFVADASHELKTPLTVIMANNSILMGHRNETIQSQMKWVENTSLESSRMRRLLDQMLFLAKSDSTEASGSHTPVNLVDLVMSVTLSFESLAFDRKLSLQYDLPDDDIFLSGDRAQLQQLLSILLDNAVKYADADSEIFIKLRNEAGRALLSVNNRGVPLLPEVQAHLFDRFYRADTARSSEGYGLGLSIAQSITTAHSGSINVDSDSTQGTTFHLSFPME